MEVMNIIDSLFIYPVTWIVHDCFIPTLQSAGYITLPALASALFIRLLVLVVPKGADGAGSRLFLDTVATILGLIVLWFYYETSIVFFIILALIIYVMILFIPSGKRGIIVGGVSVIYIVLCELVLMSPSNINKIRGSTLVVVMKLVSLAFDSDTPVPSSSTPSSKGPTPPRTPIPVPQFMAYLSYCFFPASTLFGPFMTFEEHSKYTRGVPLSLSWVYCVLRSFLLSSICLSMSMCVHPFLFQEPTWNRWFAAYSAAGTFRFSHYFVVLMSECLVLLSGAGYKATPTEEHKTKPTERHRATNSNRHKTKSTGNQKTTPISDDIDWTSYSTIYPLSIEVPRSLTIVVTSWNLPMHHFLKNYVFKPSVVRVGRLGAVLMTYIASAILHGLDFQLAAVLLSIGLYAYIESVFRYKLSKRFNACIQDRPCVTPCSHRFKKDHILVVIINLLFMFVTVFHLAYLGIMFGGSSTEDSDTHLPEAYFPWPCKLSYHSAHPVMTSKSALPSDKLSPDIMKMPCLGRPFRLGMLYDCRNENLIPGITLWDHSTLQRDMESTMQEGSKFSVICEDTIEHKASSLGVKGDLKLGVLGGLVNVSGSAKFLNDQRQSKKQARVSLQYSMTSHFEQLTMNHLSIDKIEHRNNVIDQHATHVVTAALYGAEAFFVFDRQVSGREDFRDIRGKMEVMIKIIPSVELVGDGKLNIKDDQKKEAEKLQCRYYGDILLPENPTTYQEAVKIYKQLPKLIRTEGKAKLVPTAVWLYPLCKLDSNAVKVVQEISVSLVSQVQRLIDNLQDIKLQASDLEQSDVCNNFKGIQNQLAEFTAMISEYEISIKRKLCQVLPKIRGGGAQETLLADILKQHEGSQLNHKRMSTWLNSKEQEVRVLQNFLTALKCDSIVFKLGPGELDATVADINIDYVLYLAFQIVWSPHDCYLKSVFSYLNQPDEQSPPNDLPALWFQNKAILHDIKVKIKSFKAFAEANAATTDAIKFVATHQTNVTDMQHEQAVDILLYHDGLSQSYMPPNKPVISEVCKAEHDSITITWSKPTIGAENVQTYAVSYCKKGDIDWKREILAGSKTSSSNEKFMTTMILSLEPETVYQVKVRAECEIGSIESDVCDMKTVKSPELRLAIAFKEVSKIIETQNNECHKLYRIPTFEKKPSKTAGIAKCTIGYPDYLVTQQCSTEKVLMIVGATGSGKSTLINAIANYWLGVKWEDDFRFKLIVEPKAVDQTKSVTQSITSYSFPHFKMHSPQPYQLTIVDTPGFGDTEGLQKDERITALIKTFFSNLGPEGIDHIDGIGFVAQSPLARLTHVQKYIIDSILSVFGNDIGQNIFLMTTFADGAYPPVVDAIKTHIKSSNPPIPIKVENLKYFKFNNSALFTKSDGESIFDEMYWKVGCSSLDEFFGHLNNAQAQSLQMTRDVLDEREKLQALVQGILQDIKIGTNNIDKLRQEKRILENNEANIQANKDFTYETTEYHIIKVKLPAKRYVTNCVVCNRTCHYPCKIPNDSGKATCAAMTNGNCNICPGKCHWSKHVNNDFKYDTEQRKVQGTYEELKKKYYDAQKGKATAEDMIKKIRSTVIDTFYSICQNIKKAKECLERLDEIALKPNPLTEIEYINLLIKSETDEHKKGWEKRVQCLENARKMAEIMADARKGEIGKHLDFEEIVNDLLKDVPIKDELVPAKSSIFRLKIGNRVNIKF